MSASETSGSNVVPLRPGSRPALYDERFHPLQLVVELVWALIYVGCIIALAVLASWASALAPQFGALLHRLSTYPATSGWWWTLVVLTALSGIYIWPRAVWRWRNTRLRVTEEETSRIRPRSVLWLSQRVSNTIPTRRVEGVNIRETYLEVFLNQIFRMNVADMSIDGAGTEDAKMHELRYVVDADRMKKVILHRVAQS